MFTAGEGRCRGIDWVGDGEEEGEEREEEAKIVASHRILTPTQRQLTPHLHPKAKLKNLPIHTSPC